MIGSFIADFYCHEARLIIEIDGSQHYEPLQREKDNQRTAYFHSLGLRVLRLSNADVNQNFDGVCQAVLLAAGQCGVDISIKKEG